MIRSIRTLIRDARYALPGKLENILPGPDSDAVLRAALRLRGQGLATTFGYFQAERNTPETIIAANLELLGKFQSETLDAYLSVKAPPLGFDEGRLGILAEAATSANVTIAFDAHAPKDADPTLDLVERLLPAFPGTGLVIPARWRRSGSDVARFRESTARIRIVKGEWFDPDWPGCDARAGYLELIAALAGRSTPVAVATHDPALAHRSLSILKDSGTPCELEQLLGLPRRRTMEVARRLGVRVRLYLPFGPGWWPYAFDKALARPYLPSWMLKDRFAPLETFAA